VRARPAVVAAAAIAVVALVAGLVAWAGDDGPSRVETEARRQLAVWEEFEPAAYEMTWTRTCFCGLSDVPLRITVVDGAVTDVVGEGVRPESVADPRFRDQFTVERAFEQILADRTGLGRYEITAEYDPDGWPRRIDVVALDGADGSERLVISDLRAIDA
jgi:hypothetical protein